MSLITSIFSSVRSNGPAVSLHAAWSRIIAWLPHVSLLAGVVSLAWRAALVAEPAGALIFAPLPLSTPPPPGSELVVLSANLQHGFPRFADLEERLEAFAQLVEAEGADVLLLQEVARTDSIKVDEWLRARLGMAYVYARANGHQEGIGFEEGTAIFSRYPISDPEVRELSSGRNPFTRRIALTAGIRISGKFLQVFTAHLGIGAAGNRLQITDLQNWASSYTNTATVIVGGDFNAEPGTGRIRSLQSGWTDTFLASGSGDNPNTHVLTTPWGTVLREHRLDYIFLLPGRTAWIPVDTDHVATTPLAHSDHRVVVTKLQPVQQNEN